jgi:2-isopropylmalate synthase
VDAIVGVPNTLVEFNIHAVTEGIDAMGEVTVRLQADDGSIPQRTSPQNGHVRTRTFGGYGADTDIIVASAKAYLAALNKLLVATGKYRTEAVPAKQSTHTLTPERSQT